MLRHVLLRQKHSYLVCPKLSPTNMKNKVVEWYIKKGEVTKSYGLVCTVEAYNLTNAADDDDVSLMDIEIVDEFKVLKILRGVNEVVDVNMPLAVLMEEEEEDDDDEADYFLTKTETKVVPIDMQAPWQAYIRSKTDSGSCKAC